MKKVAAVVVTYNRKSLLKENLEALLNQSYKLKNIILIDNNSTDGTEELIKSQFACYSEITYIKLSQNIGGSGGFYEGIKYVASNMEMDYIWLMDDDTIPTSFALERLIDAVEVLPKQTSYVASSVYGLEGEPMNVPNIDISAEENGYPSWYIHLDKKCVKVAEATFVSIMVNMEAVKKLGYPVRWYFIWGDDTEYTLRLTRNFGPAYLVGDSKVVHKRKNGKSLSIFNETDKDRIKNYYYYYRNAIFNYKEYYGKRKTLSMIFTWEKKIIKALIGGEKYILKKTVVLHKAIWDAYTNKKEKNMFESRMDKI